MPNIKFNYLYRDGSNYKKYGFVIFTNREKVSLSTLETLIKSKLIYDTWFYADEWKIPEIFTMYLDFRVDTTWHEFESIEFTDEKANSKIKLEDFMQAVRQGKG
jgi:hypothetical protein